MDRPALRRVVPANAPAQTLPLARCEAALADVLARHLDDVADTSAEHLSDVLRDVTDAAKDAVKALQVARYKYCVHTLLFVNRGQGIDAAAQAFWDARTDAAVSVRRAAGPVECVLSLYAVYLY